MPLERTHNIDGNGTRATGTTLYTAPGEERIVTMGIADAEAIYSMLSDLSANKGAYVLREAYSNAHDATMRAGDMSLPIEVNLTDAHDRDTSNLVTKLASSAKRERTLTVTDHGTGMSADEIACNFLQYGGSDKRDEADSIGSKGLGSKAPLAVTESFVVTSTKDGMTTTAIVERTPKKAGQGRLVTERTGAPNGTTVQIPVPDAMTFNQMQSFLATLQTYNTDANLIVNGRPSKRSLPDERRDFTKPYVYVGSTRIGESGQCPIRVWEATTRKDRFSASNWPIMGSHAHNISLAVVIGGVPYALDGHHISPDEHGAPTESIIVELQPGWLDFTPSRDEIKQNTAASQMKQAIVEGLLRLDYSEDLAHMLCSDNDAFVRFLVFTRPRSDNPYGYGYRHMIPDYRIHFIADIEENESVHVGRYNHRNARRMVDDPIGATLTKELLDEDGNGSRRMHLILKSAQKAAHILVTEPLSANANPQDAKRTMTLNGNRIVKGRISQVSVMGHQDPERFSELLVSELSMLDGNGRTTIVTGISDDNNVRRMLRLENDYRMSDTTTNSPTYRMSYVLCETTDALDDEIRWLLELLKTDVVSIDDVEAKAKERRKVANRAKRRERLAMKENKENAPLPNIQSNWMSQRVAVVPLTTNHSIPWYLVSAMNVPYRCNNTMSYRNIYLPMLIHDSHDGMTNVAIVATSKEGYDATKYTCKWAARLSALKVAGNFPLDPKVDCVIGLTKNTPTGLIRGLMARGASLICDERTNVKVPIEDTMVNRRPEIVDCLGNMSAPLLFDEDDPEPAIWTVLSDALAGQLMEKSYAKGLSDTCSALYDAQVTHRTNVSLARLVYDLLCDETVSEETRKVIIEPLATLFSRRDNKPDDDDRRYRYRGAGSAHYKRHYEDDMQIIIPDPEHPAPCLKDVPELAMRMETAVELAARASYFLALPWIADQPRTSINYMAFPGSKMIDEMRPLVTPIISQRLEELVKERNDQNAEVPDHKLDARQDAEEC